MRPRAGLVIRGQVVVEARPDGLDTAEAVAIGGDRVVAAGGWDDVSAVLAPSARVVDVRDRAVLPGLHDFHIHLVGLARTRRSVVLDDARDAAEVASRLADAAARMAHGEWITGRGWNERQLAGGLAALDAAVGERLAFISSHDGHSAWASPMALAAAGIGPGSADPPGGRIERGADSAPTGILRETALDLVARLATRLQGPSLRAPLDETLAELAGLGVTGASEAGDYTTENGIGADAELGDSYSCLTDLGDVVDGRLRLTLGIPAAGISSAAERGLRTGAPLSGRETMRFGWAKAYADGALGSGTAALLAAHLSPAVGILRLGADELDALVRAARVARIGMAIHAIGDRAVREVLDAFARGAHRDEGVPADRIEHVQLVQPTDVGRFARLGVTASVQPIHAAADRDLVERHWQGRQEHAYAWRRLAGAGASIAAGSDAPVESVNPWLGLFAAVHRRLPTDARGDWRPAEALTITEALAAYTRGPAVGLGVGDEGHLRPGARADLLVASIGLDELQAADDALADARSELTLIGGREVRRAM